VAVISPVTTKN